MSSAGVKTPRVVATRRATSTMHAKRAVSIAIISEHHPLDAPPERRMEFVKAQIESLGHDGRHVMLLVSFALAIVALPFLHVPIGDLRAMSIVSKVVLVAGIGIVLAAAVCLFNYVRVIHIARRRILRNLLDLDVRQAHEVATGVAGLPQAKSLVRWGLRALSARGVPVGAGVGAYLPLAVIARASCGTTATARSATLAVSL